MDYLSHNIAVNLKRIRASKGLSLDEAAEQTGVSKSMLHQIERDEANPSINVLGKIASGMRIEFNKLIQTPPAEACLVNIAELVPTKEVPGQYIVKTCFPYEDNRTVEIYTIEIEPDGEYQSGSHGESTREYIAVKDGQLEIECNNSIHTVTEQSVFRFESDCAHTYRNKTNKKCSFFCFFVAY